MPDLLRAGNSPASYHYETTVGGALPVISTLQVPARMDVLFHFFFSFRFWSLWAQSWCGKGDFTDEAILVVGAFGFAFGACFSMLGLAAGAALVVPDWRRVKAYGL